jgi:hypothetical protein
MALVTDTIELSHSMAVARNCFDRLFRTIEHDQDLSEKYLLTDCRPLHQKNRQSDVVIDGYLLTGVAQCLECDDPTTAQ